MTTLASGSSVTFGLAVDQTFEMTFADGTTGTITVTGPLGSPYRTTFGPTKKNNWKPFSLGTTGRVTVACTAGSVSYTLGTTSFVTAVTDATGDVNYLTRPDGRASGLGSVAKQPRILKKFNDLTNITKTDSTVTSVMSIDQNSPFGGPAMKLVITPGATGNVSIDVTGLNIKNFDGHVAATLFVDEPHRISSMQVWMGTATNFATSDYWQTNIFSGGDQVGGIRVFWGGPLSGATKTSAGGGFTMGTSSLVAVRIRATVYAGAATTLWFKDVFIPAKQRPIVCFTFDDCDASWYSRIFPMLTSRGIKATFNVEALRLNSGASYITTANMVEMSAAGHQFTSHNQSNYQLQILNSHNTGESNGVSPPSPPQDSVLYVADYNTANNTLEAAGIPPEDLCSHAWVQGRNETQAAVLLQSAGVALARTAGQNSAPPGGGNLYGFPMGNNAMGLIAASLGASSASVGTLAQDKGLLDNAVTYGGLVVFMGHVIADTSSSSITFAQNDLAALFDYAMSLDIDILTLRQLKDRLTTLGCLALPQPNPVAQTRLIGRIYGADMNSTADQGITLPAGTWQITQIFAAKGSVSMTTAAGGFYTGAGKTGTTIVAAGQVYTVLAGATTDVVALTMAATPTLAALSAPGVGLYLSLTTGQGSAATADIFVYGRPA